MVERLGRRITQGVLLWDLLLTLVAFYSSSVVRLWLDYGKQIRPDQVQLPWQLYCAVACIWATVFLLLTPHRSLFLPAIGESIRQLFASVGLAGLAFAGVLYLSFREISRLQFFYFVTIDLIVLLTLHLTLRFYFRSHNPKGAKRRTLIVGTGAQAQQLVREFASRPWVGVHVVGYTGDEPSVPYDPVPRLGAIAETTQIVAEQAIEEVIFVTHRHEEIARISLELIEKPVMLHLAPSMLDLAFARTPVETLGGIPLISLRESALTESQRFIKRFFDVVASAALLLLSSPFMLLIAIAIKLESPGPVFLRQERIGQHGRRFRMVKFRSMYEDAEGRWAEVARREQNGHLVHKQPDDPRITPLGRKLRRTSLDELPQLLNVLLGGMSLVGPRPELPYIAPEYSPWQWQRFRVPAGITGWWQVNGRSQRPMHLHTEDDLYYIQNYSFWLDLKILWRTVATVFRGQGAF